MTKINKMLNSRIGNIYRIKRIASGQKVIIQEFKAEDRIIKKSNSSRQNKKTK